jgi:CheY-like chemotaxis protein
MTDKKIKSKVKSSELKSWVLEISGFDEWLFDESLQISGDIIETISLILPNPEVYSDMKLFECIQLIESLEEFRANPHKFDLVVTDLSMPQMSGLNLARKLMEIRPGMPMILCTGFSEQANEQAAAALGIRAFLLKPLVMRDIAAAVRKVLDG